MKLDDQIIRDVSAAEIIDLRHRILRSGLGVEIGHQILVLRL
jgi:hypothetical protein